ncbi:DUF6286 domain-containing protein, partial [Streptomyces nigrescens]
MSDEDAEPNATRRLPTLDKTPGEADAATPPAADTPSPDTAGHDRVRRFWSARRVPAALVAL